MAAAKSDQARRLAVLQAQIEGLGLGAWVPDDHPHPDLEPADRMAMSRRAPSYDELVGDANAEARAQMSADFEELLELEEELDEE